MLEVQVVLDFACCCCEHSVSVTLKCAGKGLSPSSRVVAGVKVPCPTCGGINHVCFEPSGVVRDVRPCRSFRIIPEPSLN